MDRFGYIWQNLDAVCPAVLYPALVYPALINAAVKYRAVMYPAVYTGKALLHARAGLDHDSCFLRHLIQTWAYASYFWPCPSMCFRKPEVFFVFHESLDESLALRPSMSGPGHMYICKYIYI